MDPTATIDARQARGLALVKAQRAKIKHVAGSRWLVPSQTNASEQNSCTCPDHEDRGVRCKHIWAVMIVRSEVTLSDGTTIVTEKRITYRQDWPAYNAAQTEERDRVELLLKGLCDVGSELAGKLANPLIFHWAAPGAKGRPEVHGYDVLILLEVCKAIVKAADAGVLGRRHEHIVKQANVIPSASAKHGITQLVYALAGFDQTRAERIAAFKVFATPPTRSPRWPAPAATCPPSGDPRRASRPAPAPLTAAT